MKTYLDLRNGTVRRGNQVKTERKSEDLVMNVEEIMIAGVEIEIGTMTVIVNKTRTMIGHTQEADVGHAHGPGPKTDLGTMIATGIKPESWLVFFILDNSSSLLQMVMSKFSLQASQPILDRSCCLTGFTSYKWF